MIDIEPYWLGEAVTQGKPMAYVDVLKHIKFADLTDKQKQDLKQRFLQRRRNLEAAIRTIDRGLADLDKPTAAKRGAKSTKRAKKR
jgi:hypothetical protein